MSYKTFCIGIVFLCRLIPAHAQDAQQPPPPAPQPSAQQPPAQQPAPAKPPAAQPQDEINTGGGFSIEPFYWLTSASPALHSGTAYTATVPGSLDFPGKAKKAPGVVLSFPAGKGSSLRISVFRMQGNGNTTTTQELNLFTTDLTSGDALATSYTVENVKVSWDYLTYPIRPNFRLKTLWEVQYTNMKSQIIAPSDPNSSAGSLVTAKGTRQIVFPTLGLGLENTVSRHFRWELKGSGFAFPHRAVIWDAEATAAFRVGQFEILAGEKGYHFKTSPKNAQYLTATLSGAYVGVRWYLK